MTSSEQIHIARVPDAPYPENAPPPKHRLISTKSNEITAYILSVFLVIYQIIFFIKYMSKIDEFLELLGLILKY